VTLQSWLIRESGMLVVGMGERKTPKPFIAACNQFKYLDVLAEAEKSIELESKQDETKTKEETKSITEIKKENTDLDNIKAAILKMMNEVDEADQRMNMGELGSRLVKRYPDFDVRNYGDTKLSKFLRKFDFLEIKSDGKGGSSMWVMLKADKENKTTLKAQEGKPATKRKRTYKKK
jgi:hypothetical protein